MPCYPEKFGSPMLESGPESRLTVPEGELLFSSNRDGRFPYLYEVKSHPKVRNTNIIKRIIVYVQDTSKEALEALWDFEEMLRVPLGPDAAMGDLGRWLKHAPFLYYSLVTPGLFDMEDGMVVFARALGCQEAEKDVIVAWNYLGYVHQYNTYRCKLNPVQDPSLQPQNH